jgi:hypothetical protein
VNSTTFLSLLLLLSTADCASQGAPAVQFPVGPQPIVVSQASVGLQTPLESPPQLTARPTGDLIVYSATYAQTLEQGEYPAHTNYTIATSDDKVIEHVANATGSFASEPARVSLSSGEYHVRAQYDRGGFVIVPVVIEPGKTTVVDLDGEALPQGRRAPEDTVRLPDGHVVGWRATTE